ncbi:hypothetical protein BCON_0222g00030 [Botryotinia convoluta]|uniref:Uncharacterized protein n=1 Tax=Botryotinia convoluta TaxID=54673 RepID=A0A4Z1HW82_9HELO|nr:hypothetical protein BCON_0222g00030 [Botryotinia convoluta]
MSSTPSPESNGTSFPDSHIPRPSEDIDMQSIPENITYNTAGVDIPFNSPTPFVQRQIQSFLQRRAIERAENPDLVEPRSVRATNTSNNYTDLSVLPSSSERRQLQDNNAVRVMEHELDILSPDGAMDIHLPTIVEDVRAVATPGLDSRRRVRATRRFRRFPRPENQSRRWDITRRNRRARRNAMDAASGRPVLTSNLNRDSVNTFRSLLDPSNNVDDNDEAVYMDPPLPDPAMNQDNFKARRNVRSRSALSNVVSTSDLDSEDQENSNAMTIDPSYNPVTLPGHMQPRGQENTTDQRRRSALTTFTTPMNADSPSVASTSTSSSTTEPQNQSQATGTGNTTVSSRKLSQNATVRLWEAIYRTNDKMQHDLERMREEGVDDIQIGNLAIGGPSQR